MAQRRMFNAQIVSSDAFLDMPISSQGLYFHLGMSADDDGFVTPRKVLRMLGAGEDDLKVLIAKNFVVPFESGVIVITHWKMNNTIKNDRYTPTIYRAERAQLECLQNVYSLEPTRIQAGSTTDPQIGRKGERKKENDFDREENAGKQMRMHANLDRTRAILKGKNILH